MDEMGVVYTPRWHQLVSEGEHFTAVLDPKANRLHTIVYVENVSGMVDDDGSAVIHYISGMCFVRWLE